MSESLWRIREDATAEEWIATGASFMAALGSRGFGHFDMNTSRAYREEAERVLGVLMQRATLRMAVDRERPDVVLGFAIYEGDLLYWVHVYGGKKEYSLRREGVAFAILDELPIRRYAFVTDQGFRRIKPDKRGWEFAPTFAIV